MVAETLESICTRISSGGTPSRRNPEYYTDNPSGHPWVKSKELLDGGITDTEEKISEEGLKNSAAKYFPEHTVLVAMYGANVGQLGWLKRSATVNQAVCGLVIDERKADWQFVFYSLLLSRDDLTVQAQGAAQQNLNQGLIRQFRISLPPLSAQHKISSILSAYDKLIENNLRRIKILEDMARAIYREWFVEFRFPGYHNISLIGSPLGKIPQGWVARELQEVAEIVDCLHSKKPSTVENGSGILLQLANIGDGGKLELNDKFLISAEDYTFWTSRIELREGDCVVTNVGRVGAVAQIPSGIKAAPGRNMTGIRAKPGYLTPTMLIEYLLSPHMADETAKKKDLGTIMDSLNVKGIVRLLIPCPPMALMLKFDNIAQPLHQKINILSAQNVVLRRTRDLLLPRLLSGNSIPELARV